MNEATTLIKILIVEDSAIQAQMLKRILEKTGYIVAVAKNGVEGMAMAGEYRPELIISDIVMPEMDGFELCKQIKADMQLKGVPVVLLTSLTGLTDIVKGLSCGADDFITKPYEESYLLSRVNRIHDTQKLRKEDKPLQKETIDLRVADETYRVTASRNQIIDFLLSAYETAVHKQKDLINAQEELKALNLSLEKKVAERTEALNEKIQEQKAIEEELRESESRYRDLYENAPNALFSINARDNSIIECNQAALNLFGYTKEEIAGMNLFELYPDTPNGKTKRKEIAHQFNEGLPIRDAELQVRNKNGHLEWGSLSLKPVKNVDGETVEIRSTMINISERKKLEKQLQQAQKMEAIGTLAGGIAHDFNNILSAVLGYTELALSDLPEGSNTRDHLEEVFKAGNRAKDLVNQILTFSRQSENQFLMVQIHFIIKEALKLLRATLPTTIEIHQNIKALGTIFADPTQIHQIMMNLCTNAAHAMPENGGELTVSLIRVNLPDDECGINNLPPGPYMNLTVSDTGCGMTPDVLNRIFEPYYTTKEKNRGTGLGLAVVHGIVQSHGGLVTVESTPGKGSSFHIYLPEITASGKDKETPKAIEPDSRGTECILFVDDEPTIVQMSKTILEKMGYEVAGRTSSMEALELFKTKPEKFDLVITDMTMPHITGYQLSRQLIEIRPDIPIILCTGFNEKMTEEAAKKIGIREFVMKPISRQALSQTVRKVLDDSKG
ncbi:MAG: hybrid sensor histidine kinase/response regulator [Desulfobacteraceae bacterium]|nr:MAG: hybrid sensor histidine kinase/response regulator [Desulfobacteraceae bacterium]